MRWLFLFDSTYSTLYFSAFLLSVPFFHLSDEQQPELYKKNVENLCDSANNGSEGIYDVLYLPTVPGLSTSSSSTFPSSTSMTPSRQEIDHPTSSSNSSTSPTMTVSSNSDTRAREDLCGIDSYPATVSSRHVERKEQGDLLKHQKSVDQANPKSKTK